MFQKADEFFQSMGFDPMTDVINLTYFIYCNLNHILISIVQRRHFGRKACWKSRKTAEKSSVTPPPGTF